MKERVQYIDMAKGFAMITIVMLHLSMSNLEGDSASAINFFNHSFNTRLFFFLSGMVVALGGANFSRWKDAWNFGIKKTKTLLMPFVIWSVFIMPYIYERSDIHDFFQILIAPFLPPYQNYWFLLYLYVIQILFLGIKMISSHLSKLIKNDFVTELLVAALLSVILFPIYEYVFIFLLGYFFYRYGKRFLYSDFTLLITLFLFVALFTLYRDQRAEITIHSRFVMALSGILAVVGIIRRLDTASESHHRFCALLCYFGHHSLEIYLLHYFFVWILRDASISVVYIHAIPLYVIIFIISTLICLLCCKVADMMKKIPYVSFLLMGNR